MDEHLITSVTGSCDAVDMDSSSQGRCVGSGEEPKDATRDREDSEAVKLLDEELAELEKLMGLQRRKVDALERLRQQWLSRERCVFWKSAPPIYLPASTPPAQRPERASVMVLVCIPLIVRKLCVFTTAAAAAIASRCLRCTNRREDRFLQLFP